MKFRYIGATPLPQCFGFDWLPGTVHEVTDAHAIKKLGRNPMFEQTDGEKEIAKRFAPEVKPVGLDPEFVRVGDVHTNVVDIAPAKKPRAKKASA